MAASHRPGLIYGRSILLRGTDGGIAAVPSSGDNSYSHYTQNLFTTTASIKRKTARKTAVWSELRSLSQRRLRRAFYFYLFVAITYRCETVRPWHRAAKLTAVTGVRVWQRPCNALSMVYISMVCGQCFLKTRPAVQLKRGESVSFRRCRLYGSSSFVLAI